MSTLPPTFIAVGELGLFRDEDLTDALHLQKDEVLLELLPGTIYNYGPDAFPDLRED